MWLLVFIPALAGIWKFRYWSFWKWVAAMAALQLVTDFLFAAGGTLERPAGDGLITAMVRQATRDGPEVALFGIVVLGTFLLLTVLIGLQLRKAMRNKPEVAFPSPPASTGRKALETLALVGLVGGMMFIRASSMMASFDRPTTPATVSEQGAPLTLEQEVAIAAEQISRDLPKQLDATTTLRSARGEGTVLVYEYESTEQATAARVRAFVAENVEPKVCAEAEMRSEMRRGVTFRYSYKLPNLSEPVPVDITEATCST